MYYISNLCLYLHFYHHQVDGQYTILANLYPIFCGKYTICIFTVNVLGQLFLQLFFVCHCFSIHCVYWSFVEKASVKQHLKCKVCSKFQKTFLLLVRWTPHRLGFGSGWHFVRSLGQADLWSDEPPGRDICGQVCYYFGQADLWSGVPSSRETLLPSALLLQSG